VPRATAKAPHPTRTLLALKITRSEQIIRDRDARFDPVYDWQRQVELESLTDPRVSAAAAHEGIRLVDYREYRRLVPVVGAGLPRYSTT